MGVSGPRDRRATPPVQADAEAAAAARIHTCAALPCTVIPRGIVMGMAMTLRLSDAQAEALRRKAEAEHRSMQQVAVAAIDAYVQQPTLQRRRAVPVAELLDLFADLPPMDVASFRNELDQSVDQDVYFDVYERAGQKQTSE